MAKKKEKAYEQMPDGLVTLQDEYITLDSEIRRLEERKAAIQASMLELMQSNHLKKAENERIRISYIAPSFRNTFDKAKFQEEHNDLYEKYMVKTETKASIRVSIKNT